MHKQYLIRPCPVGIFVCLLFCDDVTNALEDSCCISCLITTLPVFGDKFSFLWNLSSESETLVASFILFL